MMSVTSVRFPSTSLQFHVLDRSLQSVQTSGSSVIINIFLETKTSHLGGRGVERLFVPQKYRRTVIFLQCQQSPISVDLLVVARMYTAWRSHVHNIRSLHACSLVDIRNAYRQPQGHGMGSQNLRCRCVLALAHGSSARGTCCVESAHTLCNVCVGFHDMYIHDIGEETNISIPCIICMCSFLKGGGGGGREGGGWGEMTSFRF